METYNYVFLVQVQYQLRKFDFLIGMYFDFALHTLYMMKFVDANVAYFQAGLPNQIHFAIGLKYNVLQLFHRN